MEGSCLWSWRLMISGIFSAVCTHLNTSCPGRSFFKNVPLYVEVSVGTMFIVGDFNTAIKLNAERRADTSKTLQNFADSMRLMDMWSFSQDQNLRYSRKGPDGSETLIDC